MQPEQLHTTGVTQKRQGGPVTGPPSLEYLDGKFIVFTSWPKSPCMQSLWLQMGRPHEHCLCKLNLYNIQETLTCLCPCSTSSVSCTPVADTLCEVQCVILAAVVHTEFLSMGSSTENACKMFFRISQTAFTFMSIAHVRFV